MKALHVSPQRLSRQCKVKRSQFQKPKVSMSKSDVGNEKVMSFVVMPESVETSLNKWWASLPDDHNYECALSP